MSYKNSIRPYEDLANGIIIQAVKDYRIACRRLKRKGRHKAEAEWMKGDCLRFFRSRWFGQLTEISGEDLIRRLDEEARG